MGGDIERYELMLAETEVSRMYGYVKKKPKLEEKHEEHGKQKILEVVEEVCVTDDVEEFGESEDKEEEPSEDEVSTEEENNVIIDEAQLDLLNEKLNEIARIEKRMKDQELRFKKSAE